MERLTEQIREEEAIKTRQHERHAAASEAESQGRIKGLMAEQEVFLDRLDERDRKYNLVVHQNKRLQENYSKLDSRQNADLKAIQRVDRQFRVQSMLTIEEMKVQTRQDKKQIGTLQKHNRELLQKVSNQNFESRSTSDQAMSITSLQSRLSSQETASKKHLQSVLDTHSQEKTSLETAHQQALDKAEAVHAQQRKVLEGQCADKERVITKLRQQCSNSRDAAQQATEAEARAREAARKGTDATAEAVSEKDAMHRCTMKEAADREATMNNEFVKARIEATSALEKKQKELDAVVQNLRTLQSVHSKCPPPSTSSQTEDGDVSQDSMDVDQSTSPENTDRSLPTAGNSSDQANVVKPQDSMELDVAEEMLEERLNLEIAAHEEIKKQHKALKETMKTFTDNGMSNSKRQQWEDEVRRDIESSYRDERGSLQCMIRDKEEEIRRLKAAAPTPSKVPDLRHELDEEK